MVIIIKSNSWVTLLGTSTFHENVIKEASKWIIILNNSQQPSQHGSGKNGESFKVGDWWGWQQSQSKGCIGQGRKNFHLKRDSIMNTTEVWVVGHWSY